MTATTGVLIGIEGIDAAGKRTQSSLLKDWFNSKGFSTSGLSFPDYSTRLGNEIKEFLRGSRSYSPEVRHMLFAADRWEHKSLIEERLRRYNAVVVNRYTESNFAYGIANGLPLEWLVNLEAGLPKTDLVLVLDAPPSALSGRRGRVKDDYEKDTALQSRARDAYLELANRFGWTVINAAQPIKATHLLVTSAVSDLLSNHGIRPGEGGVGRQ